MLPPPDGEHPDPQRGAHILIVESEPKQALLLDYYLSSHGYRVELVERGDVAEQRLSDCRPDLVVLDWVGAGLSGIELLRRLRKRTTGERLPILLLASGRDPSDAAFAIATGADDVITEPFSLANIALRVAALLRASSASTVHDEVYDVPPMNPIARRLFEIFAENAGNVLDRRRIHQSLWGHDVGFDRHTVDIHIARLQRILLWQGRADQIASLGEAGYRYVSQ